MPENKAKQNIENNKDLGKEQAKNELSVFCKNIKYIRKKEKLSLSKMASIMHISTTTLKKIEKEEFPKRLNASVLMDIYRCFGIKPSQQIVPIWENKKQDDDDF